MKLSWNKVLPVWWSVIWRGALYGMCGGFVLGGIAGGVAGATGHSDKAGQAGAVAGYIASIPATMLGLKQALEKHLPALAALFNRFGNAAAAAPVSTT